ncbi:MULTISPECIES: ISKra4 family transposase [Microcystis]|uniref:ISKra4 family transposase n=1 Tax=Microcystis TaxID=1125 RepID=UPI00258CC8BF|nr:MULTISPECIES: ISKra4 family transposase [Microcystis]MCA2716196.1 ISKra4 family transposase [Microcystis sp. M169S2]WNF15420.1 ISKra4 family transposase [Microcystis aeruginosa NRERC-214]
MNIEDKQKLDDHFAAIAEILVRNTQKEDLESFESIELAVREQMLTVVTPAIGPFFFETITATKAARERTVDSIIGKVKITEKQAKKLGLEKNKKVSPYLEKCCLNIVACESFERGEQTIKMMTGMSVSKSSQHRLALGYEFEEAQSKGKIESLSINGGTVRVRNNVGEESIWKNYKAVSLHGQVCAAFFQAQEELITCINNQPLARVVTCLGDGHDGIWNLIKKIDKEERREVLDWYHLVENIHKVKVSKKVKRQIETYLWQGEQDSAIKELNGSKQKEAINFINYRKKHESRMPDYGLYQDLGICIGSGSVESKIKQIGKRIQIAGGCWKSENVPQILRLRCAYLNEAIT